MDQNQTVDNDLQKAIDDITNTTSIDPVFSDPVAAPSSIPENDDGGLAEPVGPFPEPIAEVPQPAPEPMAPIEPPMAPSLNAPPEPTIPEVPAPEFPPAPDPMASAPGFPEAPEPKIEETPSGNLNMKQIKEAALRDLIPVLERLNINPAQKFNIYKDIFETLRDYSALESAYRTAKEIPDEDKRAEALLFVVEAIDKM
ncbi:hypothetical protein IIY24_02240 [Candidatus Saccharibacteria bacterium]|nr:hypothetical protein [Candidatus Saccharibacteria bacterium]